MAALPFRWADLAAAGKPQWQHTLDCQRNSIEMLAKEHGISVAEFQRQLLHAKKREEFKRKRRELEAAGKKNPGVNKPKPVEPEVIPRSPFVDPVNSTPKWLVVDRPKPHGPAKSGHLATGRLTGKRRG